MAKPTVNNKNINIKKMNIIMRLKAEFIKHHFCKNQK